MQASAPIRRRSISRSASSPVFANPHQTHTHTQTAHYLAPNSKLIICAQATEIVISKATIEQFLALQCKKMLQEFEPVAAVAMANGVKEVQFDILSQHKSPGASFKRCKKGAKTSRAAERGRVRVRKGPKLLAQD